MATVDHTSLVFAARPLWRGLPAFQVASSRADPWLQNGWQSPIGSYRAWLAGLLTILVILSSLPARALNQTCAPNNITGTTTSGRLEITEFAITQRPVDCPDADKHLGLSMPASPNQPIYFWLRLEGDRAFLAGLQPDHMFTATLHRKDNFIEQDSSLVLDQRWIVKSSALGEALANGGHFDWRLYAAAATYLVPGTYTLKMKFGGTNLCLKGNNCDIIFEVVKK